MILTVVREHHWPPSTLHKLYLDAKDHEGLEYWYKDVKKVAEEVTAKYKK